MRMVYQWILRNNQQLNYPNYVCTDYYYENEEQVREFCCVEHLYSPLYPILESGIDLEEVPPNWGKFLLAPKPIDGLLDTFGNQD